MKIYTIMIKFDIIIARGDNNSHNKMRSGKYEKK